MAIGDAAAAVGMDLVAGVDDRRDGWKEINKTRDYLAGHMTSGTHDASAITTGTLAQDRIPSGIPNSKINGGLWTNRVETDYDLRVFGDKNIGARGVYLNNPGSSNIVYINADGWMGTLPSSRRYKTNIQPAALPAALYTAGVKTFQYKNDDSGATFTGCIAEDLEKAGLTSLVQKDDEGRPDRIDDRALIYSLLALVQDLNKRVIALEKGAKK